MALETDDFTDSAYSGELGEIIHSMIVEPSLILLMIVSFMETLAISAKNLINILDLPSFKNVEKFSLIS